MVSPGLNGLIKEMRGCRLCAADLPYAPNPIFQLSGAACILIAGQAPGVRAHERGVPFDDPSGERLRDWMGVSRDVFYDPQRIAILPMGFCYPGRGRSGDLPPRPECAAAWRQAVLDRLCNLQLTLVIGRYALDWHLGDQQQATLTETVRAWKGYGPALLPLPHPSPRNNLWLRKNPWFEAELLPALRSAVSRSLKPPRR